MKDIKVYVITTPRGKTLVRTTLRGPENGGYGYTVTEGWMHWKAARAISEIYAVEHQGEQDEEHTRAGNGRCSCGGAIVFYESGESSGCAVAGRPYIYARFISNGSDVYAGGELYPDDDEELLAPPSWVTKEKPSDPAPLTDENDWHPGR
jgi:hypothetical protein